MNGDGDWGRCEECGAVYPADHKRGCPHLDPPAATEATVSPADWEPEELHRASLYGTCETCGAALAVRTVIDVDTGSSLMERFCPACGIVQ